MNNKKRKGILIGIASVFCICLILTNSYAFWSITATQSGTNVVSSGCFDLDFTEGDAINLDSQFPISDTDSEGLSPYTFTITNTCSIYASYQVNLEVLPVQGTETKLNDQYVKVSLNNSNKRILTEHEEVSTTITGAITSYKLTTGELAEDESITYDLREWLEENTPLSEGQNKTFRSKITVIAVPTPDPIFMASEPLSSPLTTSVFWGGPIGRDTVETISFMTSNEVPAGVIGSWDVGEEKNGKVMAWYTDTDVNGKYEVVVGAKSGVYAPVNSKSLFRYFQNLNSLDLTNLNTLRVTNMSGMFSSTGYSSTEFTLDLGANFDTSNVTNMIRMFFFTGYNSLAFTIDLGDNFDTSNVTDMSLMFYNTGYNSTLFTLDLGDKFDTSSVTDMSDMFSSTGSSSTEFTLDLGDKFDTSSVTDMSDMFSSTGSSSTVFTLDLGDKFDTSSVTDMSDMFSSTGSSSTEFTLDLGDKFDTSSVTDMSSMFSNTCFNSTSFTLDLGANFDTSNVTDMSDMFAYTSNNSTSFTLDLGDKFDTSNVIDMSYMFYYTGESSTDFILDLGNKFDTSKVTDMVSMFFRTGYSNPNFTLDLRNFNVNAVTTTNIPILRTGNTSHKLYASASNISFMSSEGFTGTIINCTTSPASCP